MVALVLQRDDEKEKEDETAEEHSMQNSNKPAKSAK
jgi:hypothetical protein